MDGLCGTAIRMSKISECLNSQITHNQPKIKEGISKTETQESDGSRKLLLQTLTSNFNLVQKRPFNQPKIKEDRYQKPKP